MIGPMEVLVIASVLLIPALIIFIAFKGVKLLMKLQKDVEQISKELRNRES